MALFPVNIFVDGCHCPFVCVKYSRRHEADERVEREDFGILLNGRDKVGGVDDVGALAQGLESKGRERVFCAVISQPDRISAGEQCDLKISKYRSPY